MYNQNLTINSVGGECRELLSYNCSREGREKEERSRRARERQQQVMREFAQKQQQFISAMESMDGAAPMQWDEEETDKCYTCVICNTCAPSEPHDPQVTRPDL